MINIEAVVNLGFLHEDMQLLGVLGNLDYEVKLNQNGGFISHVDEQHELHFNLEQGRTLIESALGELQRVAPMVKDGNRLDEEEYNSMSWEERQVCMLLFEIEKALK